MDKASLLASPAQPDQVSSLPHFPCLSCRKSLSSPPCPHLCNLTLLPPPPAVSLLLHLRRSFLPFIHEAAFPPRLPLLLPLVHRVANYQLYCVLAVLGHKTTSLGPLSTIPTINFSHFLYSGITVITHFSQQEDETLCSLEGTVFWF